MSQPDRDQPNGLDAPPWDILRHLSFPAGLAVAVLLGWTAGRMDRVHDEALRGRILIYGPLVLSFLLTLTSPWKWRPDWLMVASCTAIAAASSQSGRDQLFAMLLCFSLALAAGVAGSAIALVVRWTIAAEKKASEAREQRRSRADPAARSSGRD